METAVGVFGSRDTAEQSVKELLQKGVPESALLFWVDPKTKPKR